MKKILLTLTAVAGLTFASQAQEFGFEKGNVIIEGNLGFSTTNNKNAEVKNSTFSFNPKAGYFLTDKIAVGIELGVGTENEDNYAEGVDAQEKSNQFGIGAFGRYYFLELGSRFKTYTELGAGYLQSQDEETVGGTTVKDPKISGFGANLGIGANYFLTDNIAINFAFTDLLGFSTAKADVDGAKSVTQFGANLNRFNNFFEAATFGLTFKF